MQCFPIHMISEPPSVLLHLLTYARKGVLKNTQRVGKCSGSLKSAHPCLVTASKENRNQRVDGEAVAGRKVAGRGKGKVWRRGIDRETGKVAGCCLGAETREGATSRPWRGIFSLSCVRHLGRKQMGFGARGKMYLPREWRTLLPEHAALWGVPRTRHPACSSLRAATNPGHSACERRRGRK